MPKPVEVIVEVQGGVVVAVYASEPSIRVDVLDWDNVRDGDATPGERRAAKRLEKKAQKMNEVF